MRCVNLSPNNDTHIVTYISTDDSPNVFANKAAHLVISILICVNSTVPVSISPCCKRILPFVNSTNQNADVYLHYINSEKNKVSLMLYEAFMNVLMAISFKT